MVTTIASGARQKGRFLFIQTDLSISVGVRPAEDAAANRVGVA